MSSSYAEADGAIADSLGAPARPRSENAGWVLAATALAAFAAQVVVCDPYYTPLTRIYSGSLAAVTAVAIARVLVVRPQRMPTIEYALVLQYLAFGLAATGGPTPVGVVGLLPHPDDYEAAAALATASAIAMLAAHGAWSLAAAPNVKRRYMPDLTVDMIVAASGPYVPTAAAFVLMLAFAPSVKATISSVLAISLVFVDVVPLATVATAAYALRPRARTLGQAMIALAASGTVMLVTSMISSGMIAAAAAAATWWRVRGRVPLVLGGCAIAVVLVLQPVKSYYRTVMWGDQDDNVSVIGGWQRAFAAAGADRYAQSGGEATRERLSDLGTLAYVIDVVPRSMDYMGGEAYEPTLVAIVPRLLWPGKPNMTKAGLDRFVIDLGISTPELAEHSTTGLQLVTHGYASHGPLGSIVWMSLFGFAVGAANRFLGQGIAGTIAMTSFGVAWGGTPGEGFVGCFGTLWQNLFGSIALVWALWLLARVVQTGPRLRTRRRAY